MLDLLKNKIQKIKEYRKIKKPQKMLLSILESIHNYETSTPENSKMMFGKMIRILKNTIKLIPNCNPKANTSITKDKINLR